MRIRYFVISAVLLLTILTASSILAANPPVTDPPVSAGIPVTNDFVLQDEAALTGQPTMDVVDQFNLTDMDPITSCQASRGGPFGVDAEIFMGGDTGYRVDLIPDWTIGTPITSALSISDISAAAAGPDHIVAVWKGSDQNVWFGLWQTSKTNPDGSWARVENLGLQADGNPTIIVKSEYEWEVYARQGSNLYLSALTYALSANRITSSTWVQIQGVNNAASDPVVTALNPDHIGVFYLDSAGMVWFTEWTTGWEWRGESIPLTDSWLSFLPLVTGTQSGMSRASQTILPSSPGQGVLSGSRNFQVLSAISRHENHMAVFAVNSDNQLWVKEWTIRDRDDWSNTHWNLLKDGVAIEKPGVATLHIGHMGVTIRDTLGNLNYIEWNLETGWQSPTPIPGPLSGDIISRLTPIAVTSDAYWLFGIDQSGQIQHINWSQDTGWADWAAIGSGMLPDQTLAVTARHFLDVMVLGRSSGGEINNFHFTSQGGEVISTVMVPPRGSAFPPGGQALAWVNGSVVHIAGRQSELGPPYFWEIDARVMVDTDPLTATLLLTNHDFTEFPNIQLAVGDLDFDGNDEVVIASDSADLVISILDLDLDISLVISQVDSTIIPGGYIGRSGIEIADLDGNNKQDEIFLISNYIGYVYRYSPLTGQMEQIFQGDLGIADYEHYTAAVGRLYPRDPGHADPSHQYLGEQVVVLLSERYPYNTNALMTFNMITGTWQLAAIDSFQLVGCPECFSWTSAVDAGDMNGDGFDEIAAWHGRAISYVQPRSGLVETEYYDPIHAFSSGEYLSAGDIDLDGRAELLAGSHYYLSIYEIMGDDHLARTSWQLWDPSWGNATAVIAGDMDHDTFVSKLVGCKTFQEARVSAVVNSAPRWYANGIPIQDGLGSFSLSREGGYSQETGTSSSFGTTLEIGFDLSAVPIIDLYGYSLRWSIISDTLKTFGQHTTRETELIYGTDYSFEDISLGLVIANVRTYTCNYYDLYPPEEPGSTSRAMVCNPGTHEKVFHSLNTWLEMGNQGEFGYSWADVGHTSPAGVHTNSLEEYNNYSRSLPLDYRVVYDWGGSDIPLICGDQFPQSVVWWAEDAEGYSQGTEFSIEGNTSLSSGLSEMGFTFDFISSFGTGRTESESFGWMQTVGFSGGVRQFYDNPSDPGDDRPCYKVVPYVYQARAQTLGGFTYPYLELDYYLLCIGCGGAQMVTDSLEAILPH